MSDGKDETRLYGSADESNRQPPPKQGYRGEKTSRAARPAQRRRAGKIEVEEESGTAYAERSGAVAAPRGGDGGAALEGPARNRLFAVGALAAIGALAGAWWARRVRGEADQHDRHVAFRQPQTTAENFDQTRDSGPEHIRDESVGRRWDQVDEAVDESFPASDPPGTY